MLQTRYVIKRSGISVKSYGVARWVRLRNSKNELENHGNASSCTSAEDSAFLNGQNVELLDHPPYSTELALLFIPTDQENKRGQRLSAFKIYLLDIWIFD